MNLRGTLITERARGYGYIEKYAPDWMEVNNFLIKAESNRGIDRLERLVNGIPDNLWKKYARFSVFTMGVMIIGILLFFLYGWLDLLFEGIVWILEFEYTGLPSFEPEEPEPIEFDINLVAAIHNSIRNFIELIGFYYGIFLVLTPGIIIHEFGHFAACIRNRIPVSGYGLLFFYILPVGAYIDTDGETSEVEPRSRMEIYAAGPMNTMVWGTILILTSLFIILAFWDRMPTVYRLVPFVMLLVGLVEWIQGLANSIPVWRLDGAGFLNAFLVEYWKFYEA